MVGCDQLSQIWTNFDQGRLSLISPNLGQDQLGKIWLHTTEFRLGMTWPNATKFGVAPIHQNFGWG